MGLVLWIDQNEMATKLFAKVFKEKGQGFHTLSDARDFAYLVKDLNPVVIVLDTQTGLSEIQALKEQYEQSEGFYGRPVILIDSRPGLDFIKNVIGVIQRPINPFQLPDQLNKML